MKACLYCAEQIQDEAVICRFCQRDQRSAPAGAEQGWFDGHVQHRAFALDYALAILASLVVVGLPYLLYLYLRVRTERWRITSRRIERTHGILSKQVDNLELWRVQDIHYGQTLWDRMLGMGRITLTSADKSDHVLRLIGVPGHRELYERLRDAIETQRRTHRAMLVET